MDGLFNDKLKNILSDPDALKSIMSIAQALGGPKSEPDVKEQETENVAESHESTEVLSRQPDEKPDLLQISSAASMLDGIKLKGDSDSKIQLLLSIKPFLNDKKKSRVDGLVKALGAARIISSYKDINFFN
jgi:hypothetical protein